jgi:2-keto-4-pentenoate hydratase
MNGFEQQLRTWRSVLESGWGGRSRSGSSTARRTELAVVVGAGYAAAIELVDVGRPPSDLESIVAANVFHRAFVLGPTRPEPPAAVSLSVGATVHLPDQRREDPEAAIAQAGRHLAAAGERLEPGDVLLTGSRIHVPVVPGDRVELDMGALGRLGVRIAP